MRRGGVIVVVVAALLAGFLAARLTERPTEAAGPASKHAETALVFERGDRTMTVRLPEDSNVAYLAAPVFQPDASESKNGIAPEAIVQGADLIMPGGMAVFATPVALFQINPLGVTCPLPECGPCYPGPLPPLPGPAPFPGDFRLPPIDGIFECKTGTGCGCMPQPEPFIMAVRKAKKLDQAIRICQTEDEICGDLKDNNCNDETDEAGCVEPIPIEPTPVDSPS